MRFRGINDHVSIGWNELAGFTTNVQNLDPHGSLRFSGGIARRSSHARGSGAVRAHRRRLAEHGAQRRADGLDGENRVLR
jgi:hypothetical protein